MPTEQWRPIAGFPDYEVSDLGRVMSLKLGRQGVMRPSTAGKGYRALMLRNSTGPHRFYVHRLVAAAFVGPCPEGMEVRHLDGNKLNNAVRNLTYGTPSENNFDRVRHGTHPNANKTHCPRGHVYSPENTYYSPGRTNRNCRTCIRGRQQRQALRAAGIEVAA